MAASVVGIVKDPSLNKIWTVLASDSRTFKEMTMLSVALSALTKVVAGVTVIESAAAVASTITHCWQMANAKKQRYFNILLNLISSKY